MLKRTKKKERKMKHKKNGKAESDNRYSDKIPRKSKEKDNISRNKNIPLTKTINTRRAATGPFESNTKSVDSKKQRDDFMDKNTLPINHIVPEILRKQIFRKMSYNPSDCLFEKCKQLIEQYKNHTNENNGEVINAQELH